MLASLKDLTRHRAALTLLLLPVSLLAGPATRPKKPRPTPTQTPLLKAAGTCARYEPNHYVVLAEIGRSGRVFRIGPDTVVTLRVQRGARLRILYIEGPDGPIAKYLMPGPIENKPRSP